MKYVLTARTVVALVHLILCRPSSDRGFLKSPQIRRFLVDPSVDVVAMKQVFIGKSKRSRSRFLFARAELSIRTLSLGFRLSDKLMKPGGGQEDCTLLSTG